MYLKALEIQGFKSFPDKTVLTFGNDITAIVGPNGSGKSNISDAICWVMGEQSTRTLRGSKMEDVIFGGTQKRGQVGFAEVSLIIDNAEKIFSMEESEVMVTRRYYRSGESEYYINRRSVRLKDINELFMDTGLGREGYSIIGQGKIDEILAVKSGDRREVFEEAAGISKFRHRKEEAERKLGHTRDNLVRISDKIAELEFQVEPLREQASKAKRFLILREELRGLEVSVWLDQLEKLRAASIKTLSDYESAKVQLEEGNLRLEELYASAEQFAEQMREKDVEADSIRFMVSATEASVAEQESAVAVLKNNIENNRENADRALQELSDQEERAAGISAQIEERRQRIEKIGIQCAALQAQLHNRMKEAETAAQSVGSIADEMKALQAKETLYTVAAADGKAKLSALAAAAQELGSRESTVRTEMGEAEQRLTATTAAAGETKRQLSEVREQAESLSNTIKGYQIRLLSREKRMTEANDRKVKLTMEQNALRSRIHMLSEMEKDYEGFSKAVRIVMQESERGFLKNIYGPVANLIRTQDQYTVAIEIALGFALQNIVVDREEDGKAAIGCLKKRDGGRATFLPISSVRGSELKDTGVEQESGFVGIASSLVEFDKKYFGIFCNLLGRTVVVDDMDNAIAIARKYTHRFRIVTLDGQVLSPGGSMTGGSVSRSAGILSRANELARLGAQEKQQEQDLASAVKELEEAQRAANAARYEMDVARTQQRQMEDQILKLEGGSRHYDVLLEELSRNCEALKSELCAIERRACSNREETASVTAETEQKEASAAEIRALAESKFTGRSELESLSNRLTDEIAGLKMQITALKAEENATHKSLGEMEVLRTDMMGDKETRLRRVWEYKEKCEAIDAQILEKQEQIRLLREKAEEKQRLLKELNASKLALEGERTLRERESQDKNREILAMERECARLEQKKVTAALEEKQLLDRLWDNYELSHSAARAVRVDLESISKANRRIGELKREISALGTPNIGAIAEFERVNTRYEYLTSQRNDVEHAKGELESIIGNITGEMKRIFSEQFAIINRSFQATFLELFEGGTATLELEDENDILNCGIEIKVQPPGKSLKTITLLSGGEKAFAAIALYFAILKVRPTPFCVMDEIEAALDDVNVIRFARYLRNMAEQTQFIVITHRRGTMEEADVLYGVTMQEQGISRMLTINLNEVARELNIS